METKPKNQPCKHLKRHKFKKTKNGVTSTCRTCRKKITEVAQGYFGWKTTPIRGYKKRKDKDQFLNP